MAGPYIKGIPYPHDPARILDKLRDQDRFVFLDTSLLTDGKGRSLVFTSPLEALEIWDRRDIPIFFEKARQALEKGFYLAGRLDYELGYLMVPGLCRLFQPGPEPVARMWVFPPPQTILHAPGDGPVVPNFDPGILKRVRGFQLDSTSGDFTEKIGKIKDYISKGHSYQVNFTVRGSFSFAGDPILLYQALRARQPVPYSGLIRDDNRWFLSLSPELFFRKEGNRVWSRPMKGTAKRGRFPHEDALVAEALARDEKNRAENVMIVDLLRNDLGMVCKTGSVGVPKLFQVERYQTLFQMVTTVEGRVSPSVSWAELLKALFPCGSITGAPKRRTMEIIAELEDSPRGIYTGAIGMVEPGGDCAFNVAIRTIEVQDGKGRIGLGSGITIGSDPVDEYRETALKGRFLTSPPLEFSLIETLLWTGPRGDDPGGFHLLELHLARLASSASYFDFHWDEARVRDRLKEAAQEAGRVGHRVKVRVEMDRSGAIKVQCVKLHDQELPVTFSLSGIKVDPADVHLYHKTTNRRFLDEERIKSNCDEVVFLNKNGELTQGSFTNLFIKKGERLLTPPREAGLLPGTLRQELIQGGEAFETHLYPTDLEEAEAIFLGNSVRGLMPALYLP